MNRRAHRLARVDRDRLDLTGKITGLQRTWLDPTGSDKAPIVTRGERWVTCWATASGSADRLIRWRLGKASRPSLSLRQVAPKLPVVAALSAAHLAALILPPTCKRLYIAEDADPAGGTAPTSSHPEPRPQGSKRSGSDRRWRSERRPRSPRIDALTAALRTQFAPEDVSRFLLIGEADPRASTSRVGRLGREGPCAG